MQMAQEDQLPPVRVDKELKDSIDEFRKVNNISTESEAIRELIKRGLRQNAVALVSLLLFSESNTEGEISGMSENLARGVPGPTMQFFSAWMDLFTEITNRTDFDLVELAGGPDAVSKDEMNAIYNLQRGEAGMKDFMYISCVFEKMDEEKFAESMLYYMENETEDPSLGDIFPNLIEG
jgi:hypothetical protein